MIIEERYKPTPIQKVAHDSPVRYKLYGGAMGGGKTKWLCEEVKSLSLQYPGNRGVICRYHLNDFKNSTFKILLESIPDGLIANHNKTDNTIVFKNGSEIIYMGLSESGSISKLKSMELGWFAIDEASEVPKEQFLLFQSRLRRILTDGSRPMYFGILASNPEDCWLKDDFVMGKGGKDYAFFPSLPSDNPYLPKDYVDRLRQSYPEEWVRAYLEGSWDDLSAKNVVIPVKFIEDAVDKEIVVANKPVMAADIARFGGDEIVIMVGNGNRLVAQDVSVNKELTETSGRIIHLSGVYKPKIIAIDAIGVGAGVCDYLAEAGLPIKRINSAEKATSESILLRYWNNRAEMWWYAREQFIKGKVSIPNDPILRRQLSAPTYTFKGNGRILIESKDEIKKRLGNSPDRADCFVMLLWAARSIPSIATDFNREGGTLEEISVEANDSYGWNLHGPVKQESVGIYSHLYSDPNEYSY